MSKKDKQAPQEKPKAPLVVERVSVDELRLDPRNARLHPERNLTAIRASLERFGQQKPIVVKKDGTVVAGNGTLEVARQLGWTHVDVVRTELEGKDATAFAIADNRTAELAEWDVEVLIAALASPENGELEIPGFSSHDIELLLNTDWGVAPSKKHDAGEVDDLRFKLVIDNISLEDRDTIREKISAIIAAEHPTYSVEIC